MMGGELYFRHYDPETAVFHSRTKCTIRFTMIHAAAMLMVQTEVCGERTVEGSAYKTS